jgi:hypothetical protein
MSIVSTFSAASSRALGHIGHVDQRRGFDETYIPIPYFNAHYQMILYKFNYKTGTLAGPLHHYTDDQYSGYAKRFRCYDGRVLMLQMPDGNFILSGDQVDSSSGHWDTIYLDKSDDSINGYHHHMSQYDTYGGQRTQVTWSGVKETSNDSMPIWFVSPHQNTNTYGNTVRLDPSDGDREGGGGSWYGPFHSGSGAPGYCLLKDVNALGKTDNGTLIVTSGEKANSPGVNVTGQYVFSNWGNNALQNDATTVIQTEINPGMAAHTAGCCPYNKTNAVFCTADSNKQTWYWDHNDGSPTVQEAHSTSKSGNSMFREVFQMATGIWGGYSLDNMRVFKGGLESSYTWMTDLTSELDISTDASDYRVLLVIGSGTDLYVLREQNGSSYTYKMAKLIFDLDNGTYTVDGDKTLSGIGNSFSNHTCYLQYYN